MSDKTAEILTPFGDYQVPGRHGGVVELLQEMLEAAERGEIVAFAGVAINPLGFHCAYAELGTRGMPEVIGGMAMVQHDLMEEWRSTK